jgi:hypothetical protein
MALEKKTYTHRVRIILDVDGAPEQINAVRCDAVLENGKVISEKDISTLDYPLDDPALREAVASLKKAIDAAAHAAEVQERRERARNDAIRKSPALNRPPMTSSKE